jgi:hypothetical protein
MRPRSILKLIGVPFCATVATISAQDTCWESSVPSDILHNYAVNGLLNSVKFRGKPVSKGSKIVVMGVLEGHDSDDIGDYLDLEGTLMIGSRYGLVRCYMPRSEFQKLQRSSFVYQSVVPGHSQPQVAVEGTIIGLDGHRNLVLSNGDIVDWRSALLPRPCRPEPPPSHPLAKSPEALSIQPFSGQLLAILPWTYKWCAELSGAHVHEPGWYNHCVANAQAPRLVFVRNANSFEHTIIAFIDEQTWKSIKRGIEKLGGNAPCFTLLGFHGDDKTSSRLLDGLVPSFGRDVVGGYQSRLRNTDTFFVFHDAYIVGEPTECTSDYVPFSKGNWN